MPRIRSIKPDITESETLAALPLAACFTFVCLWPHCDDRGRRKAQPRLVLADLYPLRDDVTVEDVTEHLTLLAEEESICLYEGCDSKPYLHVVNWDEHQKVDRPSKSRIPPCRIHEPEGECARHEGLCETSQHTLAVQPVSSPESREGASSTREGASNGPRTMDLGPRTLAPNPARARDPIFDGLVSACGLNADELTDSARGALNKAAKDLRAVNADPAQIPLRATVYTRKFSGAALTPSALAKQWAACAPERVSASSMWRESS